MGGQIWRQKQCARNSWCSVLGVSKPHIWMLKPWVPTELVQALLSWGWAELQVPSGALRPGGEGTSVGTQG